MNASPSSTSRRCWSSAVPSVAVTSAWVSPRVNSAEPCVRGSIPTSQVIGRTWSNARLVGPLALLQNVVAEQPLFQLFEILLPACACSLRRPRDSRPASSFRGSALILRWLSSLTCFEVSIASCSAPRQLLGALRRRGLRRGSARRTSRFFRPISSKSSF